MTTNSTYADEKERIGFMSASTLNKILKLSNFEKTPEMAYFDASGKSAGGNIIEIENKLRNFTLHYENDTPYLVGIKSSTKEQYSAATTFIEAHKAGSLLFDALYIGTTPLYVTYTKDGYAIVHNLLKLKKRPETLGITAYSTLYQAKENGTKYLLELSDAYIYDLRKMKCVYKPE